MTIEINDHVLVSLTEKVLGAITHHNDAARRADSDRDHPVRTSIRRLQAGKGTQKVH